MVTFYQRWETMIDIGRMVKQLRKERGLTQDELAKRLHCSKQVISLYEGNKRQPSYDMLEAMADVFNVPISFLISDEDRGRELSKIYGVPVTPVDSIILVPLVGSIRCGPDGFAMQDVEGYIPAANVKHPTDCFYLRVTGDSMAPRIVDGDIALIRKQDDVDSGDLAAVIINGEEGTLKKVIKHPSTIILQSFNPAYAPRVFTGPDMERVHIQGKVLRTEAQWAPQW